MIENKSIESQYNTFTNNVRFYRKARKMTQETLAEQSHLSISYIKQIESGKIFKNVTFITLSNLSKALDVRIEQLFNQMEDETS